MKKYSLFIALAALLGFSSCSTLRIEKRHYTGGWYVDFGNNISKQTPEQAEQNNSSVESLQEITDDVSDNIAEQLPTFADDNTASSSVPASRVTPPLQSTEQEAVITQEDQRMSQSTQVAPTIAKQEEQGSSSAPADVPFWALFILAIFIPPLAVFLKQGVTNLFWIDLLCALFGCGFLFMPYFGGLFLVAVVIAILVIFDVI
jgi:uncharacterized membrane protein YqaE (UPF0057 family)